MVTLGMRLDIRLYVHLVSVGYGSCSTGGQHVVCFACPVGTPVYGGSFQQGALIRSLS